MSIYNQHQTQPIINASGAVTRLGGAPMPQAVLDAFVAAAGEWVPLEHLQAAASRKIAEHTATESGLVTAGSAAALTLATAAVLTRFDLGRMERLPHCDGFPHEILIAREQRSGYDHAIRAAGARLVEVGFNEIVSNAGVRRTEAWEYEAAITDNTAGIVYVFAHNSCPSLEDLVAVGRKHGLPVIVDAAGELPPRSNLTAITAKGAELVCFSGGKGIRGPQSTGILCGKRDLVASAALQMLDMDDHPELWDPPADFIDRSKLNGVPRHGIGRTLKVSKEEVIALLTALDLFASGAYDQEFDRFQSYLEAMQTELHGAKCSCEIVTPAHGEGWPNLVITVHEAALDRDAFEVCRRLRNGSPPAYVSHGRLSEGKLVVNPMCLNDETATVLAQRLREELA